MSFKPLPESGRGFFFTTFSFLLQKLSVNSTYYFVTFLVGSKNYVHVPDPLTMQRTGNRLPEINNQLLHK